MRKFSWKRFFRGAVQLAAFLLAPGVFITIFSCAGRIARSLVQGNFTWSGQADAVLIFSLAMLLTILSGRFFCG